MSRVSLGLVQVLTDPVVTPVDLSSCPPEEAAGLVEEASGFLPENATASLEGGRVVIETREPSGRQSMLAAELHDRAVHYAARGNHRTAVPGF